MEDLKSFLEEQIDRKAKLSIRFRDVQGAVTTIMARLEKMEEVSGRIILETDQGLVIGLDEVEEIGGRPNSDYC